MLPIAIATTGARFFASPRNWLIAAVLLALMGLSGLAYVRGTEIAVLKAEKATLETKLAAVGEQLTMQNAAVVALKDASDAQATKAAKAAQTAAKAVGAANARAAALGKAPVPAACPEALDWLREQVVSDEAARGAQ